LFDWMTLASLTLPVALTDRLGVSLNENSASAPQIRALPMLLVK